MFVAVYRRSSLHGTDLEAVHGKMGVALARSTGLYAQNLTVMAHAKGMEYGGGEVSATLNGFEFSGVPECATATGFNCVAHSFTFTDLPGWWPKAFPFFGRRSLVLAGPQRYHRTDSTVVVQITARVKNEANTAAVCIAPGTVFAFPFSSEHTDT